jgi:prevent-host-death family protein
MPKKKGCVMTKNVPAFIARTQFGQILERASKNKERFLVTKKGEAKAIILGVEDYLRTIVETPESLLRSRIVALEGEWCQRRGLALC